jgi:nitrogen fixation-related uncharacterized protein
MKTLLSSMNSRGGTALRRVLVAGLVLAGLAVLAPGALAHDNLGGDELAMAFWMFSFAIAIALSGAIIGWWAMKTGQFSNVEAAKYRMLENAPDLDDLV